MTPFDGSGVAWHESLPSPYTYQESDFSKLVAAVHEYEAALAVAMRERDQARDALGRIAAHPHGGILVNIARAALAVGENATEGET
jgi:hypothetical protein